MISKDLLRSGLPSEKASGSDPAVLGPMILRKNDSIKSDFMSLEND